MGVAAAVCNAAALLVDHSLNAGASIASTVPILLTAIPRRAESLATMGVIGKHQTR